MTQTARRPIATFLAGAIMIALWGPTLSNGAWAMTASADHHVVVATASPLVLM